MALREMFYGKCYLCENEVSDPVVEHFIPHENDLVKKYDWDNLYYACHRCNGIKGTTTDILNCCDSMIDVSKAIKCLCPSVPDENIVVKAQYDDIKTKNTANLLDKCYNDDNTGIRSISRESLHERLFDHYCDFIDHRRILKNRSSSEAEKEKAKELLTKMQHVSYPFSVFWKWHILSDTFLAELLAK
jgi:hypothetical protein